MNDNRNKTKIILWKRNNEISVKREQKPKLCIVATYALSKLINNYARHLQSRYMNVPDRLCIQCLVWPLIFIFHFLLTV